MNRAGAAHFSLLGSAIALSYAAWPALFPNESWPALPPYQYP
jgi:hypothetical protein